MKIPMIDPADVAAFISDVIISFGSQEKIYEIMGPCSYSSLEIADFFAEVLNRNVTVQQVQPEDWEKTFLEAGFSFDGAKNFSQMTQAVLDGKTKCVMKPIQLTTNFKDYLLNTMK